ncbi:ribonuclease P (protein C5) [Spiroplasma sabaudiense Ar-1343]|uniref:Ribonuclease P protein component n=1 Tax=Spiroplasma sabaudiense Ar-1343 TaxID=1276257 RepID=W6ABW9_9MOLU|nr:ribonuclease P protein component [Spiroplasma sabaudiense]AHI54335.1 ribonuclease P (protein C5) [Spiroplasma sabaudiense Ar-1343]
MTNAKKLRIVKKNHEFQDIINKKRFVKNNLFVVYFFKKEDQFLRYGISVGKKLGNAVLRNKAKRQVRMIMRTHLEEISLIKADIIILVRNNFLRSDFKESSNLLVGLIKNIK